ncbi:G-patch domain and KOW motifs-containing protein [Polistes fuscatus]|uniref:G-patch domain and KOW motifs-containing protein n=1 Tax=Polistes fuscatus TaxID=30207 RepID=UPI001CA9B186|nr:G-patch domain and KOW motifs-containing protein [Polistes fuscatus]
MTEEGKKISFGFAKTLKKPVLKNKLPQEQKKVDYIECLDDKDIKIIGEEEKKDEPLVIPLLGSKMWHDRIVNKIDADIFEPKLVPNEEVKVQIDVKKETSSEIANGNTTPIHTDIPHTVIKTEPVDTTSIETTGSSLEEQAAKEIIEDLKSTGTKEASKILTLPIMEEEKALRGQEESTLEDYERIPIEAFGLAVLRGMGWKPGQGIGKNEKLVTTVIPELRPKGMGLGADKITIQKQVTKSKDKQEKELQIERGTYVKITSGKYVNAYGQIEGLDDDAGRIIVKMALGGDTISLNEFIVQPVTKDEYTEKAKVLNVAKYKEYKSKESSKLEKLPSLEPNKGNQDNEKEQSKKDERGNTERHSGKKKKKNDDHKTKSKKHKRHSSVSDSSVERKSRKRRSSSSSSGDSSRHRTKKYKKTKKAKKHDKSPEQSSKKRKKKDKERETTEDKHSYHSETLDKKKHKQKRSRSRSPKRKSRSRSTRR